MLSISDEYGCLIYAKNDYLHVLDNTALYELVKEEKKEAAPKNKEAGLVKEEKKEAALKNKEAGLKIKMPGRIQFLSIQEDFLFVQHANTLQRYNLSDIVKGDISNF